MIRKPRQGISRTTRFEVFKRDKFTCQYCGRSAPVVILEVDHIKPVSKDGDNDILNLATSCVACNGGKSNRELSDDASIQKRKAQLDELQERREQIEMMLEWQRGLVDLKDKEYEGAVSFWNDIAAPYRLTASGLEIVRGWVSKYGFKVVIESIREATDCYLIRDGDSFVPDSVNKAFDYTARICVSKKASEKQPYMRDLYYIRGMVKRRASYFNPWIAMQLLKRAAKAGVDIDELKELAESTRTWAGWHDCMLGLIDTYENS